MLEHLCGIYNYVDDNTVGVCTINIHILCSSLERISDVMFEWLKADYKPDLSIHPSDVMFTWFTDNFVQTNPRKYQVTTFGLGSTLLRVTDKEITESQTIVKAPWITYIFVAKILSSVSVIQLLWRS